MSTKVVTGKVRLSFPHLFEPFGFEDNTPRYSTMVLVPKTDTETIDKLRAAEKEAAEKGAAKFGGKVPAKVRSILKDGDGEDEKTGEPYADTYPERAGHYFMTVSSDAKYRPGVVDGSLSPILDQSEVYSGVYARVSVSAFAYSVSGNKGVSFGLNNVQIIGGGEPLDGRVKAEDEFDSID